jgi:hypothetical protein
LDTNLFGESSARSPASTSFCFVSGLFFPLYRLHEMANKAVSSTRDEGSLLKASREHGNISLWAVWAVNEFCQVWLFGSPEGLTGLDAGASSDENF